MERDLLARVSFDHGWALLERFSDLVRESGSDGEAAAADYISARLAELDIEHEVYEPDLYLSLPRESHVEAGGRRFRAKPPSFSASTEEEGLEAELVHVPSARVTGQRDLFASRPLGPLPDVAGKIVLTEGYAMPGTVRRFEAAGAAGQIYTNPGRNIHWGICTPVWGTPTTDALDEVPRTPILAVNRPDGEELLRVAEGGGKARLRASLDEGWYPCKLPVVRIGGRRDEFLLVHGHYDSWDVGIGDNAVGDATLLELARIFASAPRLERSLWIAWWPGHSTGRYAGSTWFADEFALELRERCVGAVNIDSPGCWHATEYDEVMWMAEAGPLCESAIRDATGKRAHRLRPLRAGDYSFNQLGLTSFYMLLSNIPEEERDELGFYPTGGCGGNIAWHTEDDVMEVADRSNLERDLRVYVTSIGRVLEAGVLPYDFRLTAAELAERLEEYAAAAGERLDLGPAREAAAALATALDGLYARLEAEDPGPEEAELADGLMLTLARILVPLGYAERGPFEHDPALPRAPIPRLARIGELDVVARSDPELLPFLRTELKREANHVTAALREARRAVEGALERIGAPLAVD